MHMTSRSIQKTPSTRERSLLGKVFDSQGRRYNWLAAELSPPVHRSAVWRWCSGEDPIPAARIPQLAAALGVTPEEITG